ncbi:hypothetical protein BDR26DRAFT_492498 [Obelidium mucronatum]|nr:hypothetical protein BDR26DRAFT_492498 [Obelidium mucronatum]
MVQEHSSLSKLNESLPLANLSWETRLAVFLIVNRNNSQYTPLWEFLPTKIATPLSWPVDKLNLLLNGTHLLSEITKQREAISASFKIVEPHLPPTTTLADFTWAWQMFGSRVWDIELGDGKQGTAMVPVLDLVNHAANPKAEVDYSKETRRVEMVAAQDINAGEWLDISYGEKSSADLLKYYGFTVPENDSNESCVVEMMTGGEVCDFQVGMVEYSVKQCVGSNGKVDLTRLKELLDAIKRRLGEYPTTIDEDFELLRYIDFIDFDLANALRVRRAEKLCLSTVFEHGTTLL